MGKRENWLFGFAALGALAALTKILEYFGVTFISSKGANVSAAVAIAELHTSSLLWAISLFLFSFGLSAFGFLLAHRRRVSLEAQLRELTASVKLRDGTIAVMDKDIATMRAVAPASVAPSGILADLEDIQFEGADYGSEQIRKPALHGLLGMLADSSKVLPDGAVCITVQSGLVGGDPHEGPYKYMRFSLSGKVHEGKTLTIRPGDRLLVTKPVAVGLEYVSWHGSDGGGLPTKWPDNFSTPSWVSIKNRLTTPAQKAENVTALLGFVNSQRTQLVMVPNAVWYHQQTFGRHGMTEGWSFGVSIEGGDTQSFVLFAQDQHGRITPHKGEAWPLPPLDYDRWDVKIVVTSDNVSGFEGILRFTQTRNSLSPDQPAFIKLRDLRPRLETIEQFLR